MKKNNFISFVMSVALVGSLVSCENFLSENDQNGRYNGDVVWDSPKLAEGVLLKGYGLLPSDYTDKSDYATDDMVTNLTTDGIVTAATGQWTSRNSPFSGNYATAYNALMHINNFLDNMERTDFAPASDQDTKDKYQRKFKGEAYALRAWWQAKLLMVFGGEGKDGNLLGFPIVTTTLKTIEDAKIPRATYTDCVKQILADCDEALKYLPLKWEGDDRVMGASNINRINGLCVKALKARVLLFAASPAFAASGYTMEEAAEAAAEVMKNNNGISDLDTRALSFYDLGNDVAYLNSCNEVLWYTSIGQSNEREKRMFPPTLFGSGEINPSQNFVDCFPDKDGYPIDFTNFDRSKQYENRDPRLDMIVYHDGSYIGGAQKVTLNTKSGNDAINPAYKTATRSGYYLKKLLDEDAKCVKNQEITTSHYFVHMRYTEVLLNFAEAANAAVGPDVKVGDYPYTAREVINAIRKRGGITNTDYVNSLDQTGLAELIRNERRIELSFEGFRFWDLRRWMDYDKMNETVRGYDATTNSVINNVEERIYQDYMIYAPLSYSETQKYNLVQNKGWE